MIACLSLEELVMEMWGKTLQEWLFDAEVCGHQNPMFHCGHVFQGSYVPRQLPLVLSGYKAFSRGAKRCEMMC